MPENVKCDYCGSTTVQQTAEGLLCNACQKVTKHVERAVHHEGFPHVVVDENEQEP